MLATPQLPQQQTSFQRGLDALQQNRTDIALEEFTAAENEHPRDATIHNFRGIVLAKLGHGTEAASEYREAIRLSPLFGPAYRNLGFLEWNEHRLDSALSELDTASRLAPEDNFALYYRGRVELELHRYDAAFRHLQGSAIPLPDDSDVLLRAARGYFALGKQSEAKAIADRLALLRLTSVQTAQVAASLAELHENDAAIRLLHGWRRNNPHEDYKWNCSDLALIYLLTGRYEDVAAQASQILSAESKPEPRGAASAWSLIGIAKAHMNQPEQAVEAFHLAVHFAPNQEDHRLNLSRELMDLNRFADAIAATQEAILAHPKSYALQLRLGAAYLAVDRYSDAEATFRKLIVAGDPLPTSVVGLTQVLLRMGRADEAVAELVQAKRRIGRSFLLSYFEGLAYNRAGKPDEAASSFQEALDQEPQSAEAHFELGKTELKLGHFDVSISELHQSLQLNNGNLPAQRLLKQAYRRAGASAPVDLLSDALPANLPTNAAGDFIVPEWQTPAADATSKITAAPPLKD